MVESGSRYYLQTLERGLTVIKALGEHGPALTLSALAKSTDLPRAAVRRILLTLVDLGYVGTDGRTFSLTPRILGLGAPYLAELGLPQIGTPHLKALGDSTGEALSMAIQDGDDALTIITVPTTRIMTVVARVGSRLPLYCSSTGRVLLAGMSDDELDTYLERVQLRPLTTRTVTDRGALRSIVHDVRRSGFSLVDQELEEGLRSVSVPIHDHDHDGKVVAACNMSLHPSRATLELITDVLLPQLLAVSREVEHDLRATAAFR